ncbi:hypothetical protein CDAR_741, partial [Caerostris darwini]
MENSGHGSYLIHQIFMFKSLYSISQKIINCTHIEYKSTFTYEPGWFKNHVAYTMAKYGMSMYVLGMAAELKSDNIHVNAVWPKT